MSYARYLSILIAIAVAAAIADDVGSSRTRSQLMSLSYLEVCRLVEDNFYQDSEELHTWAGDCRRNGLHFSNQATVEEFTLAIERALSVFSVSHLSFWGPTAMRAQWLGESRETGLRARMIEGHAIVTQLVEGGPAWRAGVRLGDEVLAINGRQVASEWEPRSTSGVFSVLRLVANKMDQIEFNITGEDIQVDLRPQLEILDGGSAILTIPSFVATSFEKQEWLEIAQKLVGIPNLVVDLRENSGGNFAAMLRALSVFVCEPTKVGKLVKPRKTKAQEVLLEDNLELSYQQGLINNGTEISLQTFSGYPCYRGDVTVLIDQGSASVTEVFAQALSKNRGQPVVRIWGDFSAGEVVQAVFFSLPLGTAYTLSVPDSLFLTSEGQSLEGVGVRPIRALKYDLVEGRKGVDSWVREALNAD